MQSGKILIINGPNLNMLGEREPEVYGRENFTGILAQLQQEFMHLSLHYYQSNHEGALIDKLQTYKDYDAIIINGGAYSHYSYAIQDAIRMINVPVIEVHMSNIYAREPHRANSVLSAACSGVICGMGKHVYFLACEYVTRILQEMGQDDKKKK